MLLCLLFYDCIINAHILFSHSIIIRSSKLCCKHGKAKLQLHVIIVHSVFVYIYILFSFINGIQLYLIKPDILFINIGEVIKYKHQTSDSLCWKIYNRLDVRFTLTRPWSTLTKYVLLILSFIYFSCMQNFL